MLLDSNLHFCGKWAWKMVSICCPGQGLAVNFCKKCGEILVEKKFYRVFLTSFCGECGVWTSELSEPPTSFMHSTSFSSAPTVTYLFDFFWEFKPDWVNVGKQMRWNFVRNALKCVELPFFTHRISHLKLPKMSMQWNFVRNAVNFVVNFCKKFGEMRWNIFSPHSPQSQHFLKKITVVTALLTKIYQKTTTRAVRETLVPVKPQMLNNGT